MKLAPAYTSQVIYDEIEAWAAKSPSMRDSVMPNIRVFAGIPEDSAYVVSGSFLDFATGKLDPMRVVKIEGIGG